MIYDVSVVTQNSPFSALETSSDVQWEVFPICQNDAMRRPVPIPVVNACPGETGFEKTNVSGLIGLQDAF